MREYFEIAITDDAALRRTTGAHPPVPLARIGGIVDRTKH